MTTLENIKNLSTQEKIQALIELKDKMKTLKNIEKELQLSLYFDHQQAGFDTMGGKGLGQSTVVYKTDYILQPEAKEKVFKLDEQLGKLAVEKSQIEKNKKAMIEQFKLEGLAKEDKHFSYIKITKK